MKDNAVMSAINMEFVIHIMDNANVILVGKVHHVNKKQLKNAHQIVEERGNAKMIILVYVMQEIPLIKVVHVQNAKINGMLTIVIYKKEKEDVHNHNMQLL